MTERRVYMTDRPAVLDDRTRSPYAVAMNDDFTLLPMDPLGEVLHHLRLSGALYSAAEGAGEWGVALPPLPRRLMFHIMTRGECWLEQDGQSPCLLRAGDLALVPHGAGHRLTSAPGSPVTGLFDLRREAISHRYEVMRLGPTPIGTTPPTTMLCGLVAFEQPVAVHLLAMLPPQIVVTADTTPDAGWLRSTVRFLASEARTLRPGGEVVITRLADVLVIQAIRVWLEQSSAASVGWLGALRDERIGQALCLIHQQPARNWTVGSLAAAVAMSRSAFAARFTALVGEGPLHYLTRWRLLAASSLLRDSDVGLAEIARAVGYQSEAAFSRAFKRQFGHAPSQARHSPASPAGDVIAGAPGAHGLMVVRPAIPH